MKSRLFGCVVIHALCCWLTCTGNIYYDESDLGKVCLKKDSRCYDYGIAEFGSVERYTTTGLIVPALPSNACVAIEPKRLYPSCNAVSGIECFLLVQKGGCSYAYKALMAEQSGYQFVIIYSPTSDAIETMGSGKYGSKVGQVMSVYVGMTAGNDLLNHNYSTGAEVTITPPPFFPNLEFYLIPFVIIVGICFVLMAMFMVSRYYRSFLEKRRNRITPANLKKIPTKKFKKGDVYYDVCAICLDEYKDGDKLRILPCDHVYHCKCVDPWLTEGKKTCPVCKRPVESKTTRNRSAVERGARQDIDSEADENTPLIQPSQTTSGGTIDV